MTWRTRSILDSALLILLIAVLLPAAVIAHAAVWMLPIAGIAIIVLWTVYYWATDEAQLKEVISEISFLLLDARDAWIFCSGVSLILGGLYVGLVQGWSGEIEPGVAASALAFHVAIIAGFLGIDIIYRRSAPILTASRFLRSIIHDIQRLEKGQGRLLVVYPALSFGYYRFLRAGNLGLYERYREAILRLAEKGTTAIAVTYPIDCYRPLFEHYVKVISDFEEDGEPDTGLVTSWLSESLDFADRFRGTQHKPAGALFEMDPDRFPAFVIVIGDVVYHIASHGLPVFRRTASDDRSEGTCVGEFEGGEGRPVSLYVFRRRDTYLADQVFEEIQMMAASAGKAMARLPNGN